jgi:hypothetical protein
MLSRKRDNHLQDHIASQPGRPQQSTYLPPQNFQIGKVSKVWARFIFFDIFSCIAFSVLNA